MLNFTEVESPETPDTGWDEKAVPCPILQRTRNDCGVACLAMAAGISYEGAHQFFTAAGLSVKRGQKKPCSTNFKELQLALDLAGLNTRRKLFRGWSSIGKSAILKVNVLPNGNWHWVYAGRHAEYGLFVLDPSSELPAYENMPMDVMCRKLSTFLPEGNFIEIGP